jgi:hypothetical protein
MYDSQVYRFSRKNELRWKPVLTQIVAEEAIFLLPSDIARPFTDYEIINSDLILAHHGILSVKSI